MDDDTYSDLTLIVASSKALQILLTPFPDQQPVFGTIIDKNHRGLSLVDLSTIDDSLHWFTTKKPRSDGEFFGHMKAFGVSV